ncbi:MAG: 50S ribosomal protein L6 [Desulfobulbaceae bacterium]|nr:50S ribosomal protein L6 [Desulfobulbaceae bacterium]
MSRIGNKPIQIPSDVKIDVAGMKINVIGPKGAMARDIRPELTIEQNGGLLIVKCNDESKQTNAYSGLTRSLLYNMVTGVSKGFQRKLVIEGVGYRASVTADVLTLNVGYSNPVEYALPAGVTASVDKSNIVLDGIDNELLGLTAAKIRNIRKPEPYKGKGIRYDDERIVRKAGKSAGKGK